MLQQSSKMEAVGLLAGGIAHDFNNILTVIKGFTELALFNPSDQASVIENLQDIQAAEERATELVKQLLAFGRKQILQPSIFDLNIHLEEMQTLLRRLIRENIELELQFDLSECKILADPVQIEQIIVNLVVNARDAIVGHGKITLSTAILPLTDVQNLLIDHQINSEKVVRLSISDSGIGMSLNTLDHIFAPFLKITLENLLHQSQHVHQACYC